MNKITNITDFLYWAKQVNLCFSSKGIPDLQDEFARTDRNTLKDIFLSAGINDRRLLMFGIYKAMSDDVFFDYVNMVAEDKFNKLSLELELELSNSWAGLSAERSDLDNKAKQIKESMQKTINLCN